LLKNDAVVASGYYPDVAITGPRAVGVESTPIASTSSVAAPISYPSVVAPLPFENLPYHLSSSDSTG